MFSGVGGSASECHLQLLKRQVDSVARLCPDQTFLSLCHRRHVAALCLLYKVNSNSRHGLFSELSICFCKSSTFRAVAAAHPLEFEVSRCRPSQFARCRQHGRQHDDQSPAATGLRNDLPYTVFDTGTIDGFKGAVNRWLVP